MRRMKKMITTVVFIDVAQVQMIDIFFSLIKRGSTEL